MWRAVEEKPSDELTLLLQRDLGTELAKVRFDFYDGRSLEVINSREVPVREEDE